jgi:cytochrome c biogenesis protein CcdA
MLHPLVIHLRDAIIAGSTGRMAMLLIIYGGPFLGLPRMDVVGMLGALAARNKQDAATLGGAIHFALGILFAFFYAALWSIGIGRPTWEWGLIFGSIHGMLVILLLLVFTGRYPQNPQQMKGLPVIVSILLNHIVYGIVVAIVYSS